MRSVPPGSTGFCFCFDSSGSAEIGLSSMRGDVMAFLSLSRLLCSLHLSGELFQLFYQELIGEAECLHLVRVGLHRF